jgi:hypothetical protein
VSAEDGETSVSVEGTRLGSITEVEEGTARIDLGGDAELPEELRAALEPDEATEGDGGDGDENGGESEFDDVYESRNEHVAGITDTDVRLHNP